LLNTKARGGSDIITAQNAGEAERKKWQELFNLLEHPLPLVVIDRVEKMEREKSIKTLKAVTANEAYLAGHFPGNPIMPGVLTLEGMVQSAILLVADFYNRGRLCCTLEKVDRVRFKQAIVPGDRIEFLVQLTAREGEFWKFKGQALAGGETAAEANLILKVHFHDVGFEL